MVQKTVVKTEDGKKSWMAEMPLYTCVEAKRPTKQKAPDMQRMVLQEVCKDHKKKQREARKWPSGSACWSAPWKCLSP